MVDDTQIYAPTTDAEFNAQYGEDFDKTLRAVIVDLLDGPPAVEKAEALLYRFPSQNRAEVFLHMLDVLRERGMYSYSPGEFMWSLVMRHWSGFDRIPYDEFCPLFKINRRYWSPNLMTAEHRAVYDALPESFIVWRGQDRSAPLRLSWTRDRDTARRFAKGHRSIYNPDPTVRRRTISKSAVAFTPTDRDESEVVLFEPPRQRMLEGFPSRAT